MPTTSVLAKRLKERRMHKKKWKQLLNDPEKAAKRRARTAAATKRYRERLKSSPKYEQHKHRQHARQLLKVAINKGDVQRAEQCSECAGTIRIEAHHDDYSQPLAVRWLCRACHNEFHFKERRI